MKIVTVKDGVPITIDADNAPVIYFFQSSEELNNLLEKLATSPVDNKRSKFRVIPFFPASFDMEHPLAKIIVHMFDYMDGRVDDLPSRKELSAQWSKNKFTREDLELILSTFVVSTDSTIYNERTDVKNVLIPYIKNWIKEFLPRVL